VRWCEAPRRPSARLAHTERRNFVATDRWRQELVLHLARAEVVDHRRRHVRLDEQAHRDARGATAGKLLGLHHAHPEVAAAASDVFGVVRTEDPELTRSLEHRVGKELFFLPLVDLGRELALRERPNLLAKNVVLLFKGLECRRHSSLVRK
jgi:hypothetical protein